MAQEVKITLVCDADGDKHEAAGTYRLQGPDSNPLEVDLCNKHLADLKKATDKWVAMGRNVSNRVGTQTRKRRGLPPGIAVKAYDPEDVRRWAKLTGLAVADSGRLSPTTIKKWRDAGSPTGDLAKAV